MFRLTLFFRLRTHLRELTDILEGLDQKHLFAACAPKPKGAYERHLFALLRRSGRAYVEGWGHEIKTPITAAQLICRNADKTVRRKLLPKPSRGVRSINHGTRCEATIYRSAKSSSLVCLFPCIPI